jgi:hypothetical protein
MRRKTSSISSKRKSGACSTDCQSGENRSLCAHDPKVVGSNPAPQPWSEGGPCWVRPLPVKFPVITWVPRLQTAALPLSVDVAVMTAFGDRQPIEKRFDSTRRASTSRLSQMTW